MGPFVPVRWLAAISCGLLGWRLGELNAIEAWYSGAEFLPTLSSASQEAKYW